MSYPMMSDFDNADDYIEAVLDLKAAGKDIDEDALMEAAVLTAAVALVRGGAHPEDVARQFDDREFQVRFVRNADKLEVIIDWLDEPS